MFWNLSKEKFVPQKTQRKCARKKNQYHFLAYSFISYCSEIYLLCGGFSVNY